MNKTISAPFGLSKTQTPVRVRTGVTALDRH